MKFIALLFLAAVITFGLVALGYWLRVLHEMQIQNKLTEKQLDFILPLLVTAFVGIVVGLAGMFLL